MNAYFIAAIAGAALAFSTNASAQNAKNKGLVVEGSPEVRVWSDDVTDKLDRRLDAARPIRALDPATGIVQVRFSRDDNGRPRDVRVYRSAAPHSAKAMAMRAVRNLRDLPPLPSTYAQSNDILANLVFANSEEHLEDLSRKLRAWETERLARSPSNVRVLALNTSAR